MKRWNTLNEAVSEGDIFYALAEKKEMSQDEFLEIAKNAIDKGKYLSAVRAYEKAYGEEWKNTVLDEYIRNGSKYLSSGDLQNAFEEFTTAARLNEPVKLYQTKGLEFHKLCGSQFCVLQEADFNKIADSIFQYFLNHEKILDILEKQDVELKKGFLKLLIKEQNPGLNDFLKRFSYALEILKKSTDHYISLKGKLAEEEKAIKEIPQYNFSLEDVKEIQDTQINDQDEIEATEVKEKVNFLLKKLEKFNNSNLMEELNRLLDDKENHLLPLDIFQEAEIQSEYANSLEDEIKSYGKLVKESSEMLILDLLEISSEKYSDAVSKDLFSRLIDFIKQFIQLKSDLLVNHLKLIYTYSQRILLGRKTGTDNYWQYMNELSVSYPISAFLVCTTPNAFLRSQSSSSNDILKEIRGVMEVYKFVIPIIR